MTTYTIDIPDRCPRCKKDLTARAEDGGFFAEFVDCSVGASTVPRHRAPIVIIAGAEAEEIKVFNVLCVSCDDIINKRNRKVVEAAKRAIAALKAVEV